MKAGKLMLGTSDPFRHSLIGLAPIFSGLAIIYFIGKFFSSFHILFSFTPGESIRLPQGWFAAFLLFAIFYLLFTVSVTMFSSRKDIESVIIVLPILIFILFALNYFGVKIVLENKLLENISLILKEINIYLLLMVIINTLVSIIFSLNLWCVGKILNKKVVRDTAVIKLSSY